MPGRKVQICICDKTVTGENTVEYSMPDYQPEIRRLLRVKTTIMPPSSYVGGGKAEFSGNVRYDVLYSGSDGGLYSVNFSDVYELSAPIDSDSEIDYSDELISFCEVEPDSVVSRVIAPRKLSIRCRLHGHIRAYGSKSLDEKIMGEASMGSIQRLCETAQSARLCRPVNENFEVVDEIIADGEALRIAGCDASVFVADSTVRQGSVNCGGDVILRILVCDESDENAVPSVINRKVPFRLSVESDDFSGGMSCRAHGCCSDVELNFEGGKIMCHIKATLCVECQENIPVSYTRDIFSTDRENTATYSEYELPVVSKCFSGNFTQSLYEPVASYGIGEDCSIIDITASSICDNVIYDKGKWIMTGESRLNLLMKNEEDYLVKEIPLPFRYEFDGEEGIAESVSYNVSMMSGRVRNDSGRLGIDCEMAVGLKLLTVGKISLLTEATFTEPIEKTNEYIVYFPSGGETLWDVAKKYHAQLDEIKRMNGITSHSSDKRFIITHGA